MYSIMQRHKQCHMQLQMQRHIKKVSFAIAVLIANSIGVQAQTQSHKTDGFTDEQHVTGALRSYADMLRGMKYYEMSNWFADSGAIVNPGQNNVVGPRAIRSFLEGFSDYKIIEYRVDSTAAIIAGNTAKATARFMQTVRTPVGDTLHVYGHIQSKWIRFMGGWKILEMATTSDAN